jgi:hypothetical protein
MPVGPPSYPLTRPAETAASPASSIGPLVLAVTLVLAVVGLIIEVQPVSLLTGSGTLYVGLALTAGGAVLAFVMKLRTWVRVITAILVVICIVNVAVVEKQLNDRRHEIQQDLSNLGG